MIIISEFEEEMVIVIIVKFEKEEEDHGGRRMRRYENIYGDVKIVEKEKKGAIEFFFLFIKM